jgi:hypothetical protein
VKVVSVTYHEDGRRFVGVDCSQCPFTHQMIWPAGAVTLSDEVECESFAVVHIPVWARNPRRDRTRHKFDPAALDQISAGQGRDDNAVDVPVPNWTE